MTSIRRRLLLWLSAGIGVLLTAAALTVYFQVRDEVWELFDAQMLQSARAFPQSAVAFRPPSPDEDEDQDSPLTGLAIEVWAEGADRPTYRSSRKLTLPALARAGFSNVLIEGERWRLLSESISGRRIVVGQPLSVRSDAADQIAGQLLLPLAAALPLAMLLIWIGVGRGLSPLRRAAREIERRSDTDLAPLQAAGLASELKPMVLALNDLMRRVSEVLLAQQHFVADAAHELLTPLTALQLQAQWMQRATSDAERSEGVRDLRAGIERVVRLARQLLVLARQDSEMVQARAQVDIAALAREVIAEQAATAAARAIDIGFDSDGTPTLATDADAVRILVSNLVDNAIKYTPVGGRVDVKVIASGKGVLLRVEDSGGGIPADDLQRVFDRFYRPPGQMATGSGLGLAIVRKIAERDGATLNLRNGSVLGGLIVECRWS